MAFERKKGKTVDPISDRARALNNQIAALEAQIKKLGDQIQHAPTPRLRSTVLPHAAAVGAAKPPPAHEPVFEEIKPMPASEENATDDQFNELGVRKFDFPALISRLRRAFSRPATPNPSLVRYLAAGGVRGLRPLRYEKRVARNRFIFFAAGLFLLLLGILWVYLHHR